MKKLIRTKDGRIIDVEKFIEGEKKNPYYTDYQFEEIKNEEDCCSISWSAIGTEKNNIKDQIGRRCQFSATINSPFIKQADTVKKLCDGFVLVRENVSNERMKFYQCLYSRLSDIDFDRKDNDKVYGAIWTDKGLIYVAKMKGVLPNGEIDLELL